MNGPRHKIIYLFLLKYLITLSSPLQVTESDAVDVIEIAIKHHISDLTTRAMCLVALLKLSSRLPTCSEYVRD